MANLKNLSERIKSVTSIQQVTKAMKMVAAAKVKKAQEKMEISRPYSKSTQELICRILPQISVSDISLVEKRKVKNTGIIVITSDRGFAGSFNSSVIRLAEKEIEKGIVHMIEEERVLVEGAAGTSVAALIKMREQLKGKRVAIIVCGKNISLDVLKRIL